MEHDAYTVKKSTKSINNSDYLWTLFYKNWGIHTFFDLIVINFGKELIIIQKYLKILSS